MSRYRIQILPAALNTLETLPEKLQRQITRKIDALAENPRPSGCTKLKGSQDVYRLRSGDYRIIFQIQDEMLLMLVLKVGHRRDVYRQEL